MIPPNIRRIIIRIWLGTIILSLIGLVGWFFFGHLAEVKKSVGNDTFSKSALGHQVFVEFLKREGFDVRIVRTDPSVVAGTVDLMILAEPYLNSNKPLEAIDANETQRAAKQILVISPKRWGAPQLPTDEHIHVSGLESISNIEFVLNIFAPQDMRVLRGAKDCEGITLPELQTLSHPRADVIIGCDLGALLLRSNNTYFLSDPDLIANHRLDEESAHEELRNVLAHIVQPGASIAIDETFHGHKRQPTLGELLTKPPLLGLTLQLLFTFLILGWAAYGRFGPPVSVPASIPPGKQTLLQNTSELLNFAGYQGRLLERYFRFQLEDLGARFHAPSQDHQEILSHLAKILEARKIDIDIFKIAAETQTLAFTRQRRSTTQALRLAQTIHRLRKELLHDT